MSSFVSFINDNEKVINFQVNISKLIEKYTAVWNELNVNGELNNNNRLTSFKPTNINDGLIFLLPALLIGTATGIYSFNSASIPNQSLPAPSSLDFISLTFPSIIFTNKSTDYFNFFF